MVVSAPKQQITYSVGQLQGGLNVGFFQNTRKEGGIGMKYTGQYWIMIAPFMKRLLAKKYGQKTNY